MAEKRRQRRSEKAPACPRCGGTGGVAILYGLPSSEIVEAVERGEIPWVAIGGCVIEETHPVWACPDCGHRW